MTVEASQTASAQAAGAAGAASSAGAGPTAATATPTIHTTPAAPPAYRDLRRAQIVDAARTLYEEKGMSRTSIQDITASIGVARSLFYHYFDDKEAVTSAVIDTYIEDIIEAMHYWNAEREQGKIEDALDGAVRLMRIVMFDDDSFRIALATKENAELYIDFLNRAASHAADYIIETTVVDYGASHEIRIDHIRETFYILIVGLASYLRRNPDADDELLKDLIAQTLHMDR